MATAVRDTVKTEVTKVESVPVIKLELTEEEATLVHALIGGVAGGYDSYFSAIWGVREALSDADVTGWWHEYYQGSNQSNSWTVKKRKK